MGGDWNGDVLGTALSQFFPTLQNKTYLDIINLLLELLDALSD